MSYTIYCPEKARSVRGVLFDMDGIILDTEKLYTRFWQEAGLALGYPMTREHALGMRSLNRSAGEAKLKSYFGPDTDYHAVRSKRMELMDAFTDVHGVEAKPGICALLDELDRLGIPRAITTSSPRERVERHLGPLGLLPRFDAVCTGYEVEHGKPEPDIYLYGARVLGVDPKDCLALEDSPAGCLSAHRAGCMTVMVPDQDPLTAPLKPLLYAHAEGLTDVIDLLK